MKFLPRLTLASVIYTCFLHGLESTCVVIPLSEKLSLSLSLSETNPMSSVDGLLPWSPMVGSVDGLLPWSPMVSHGARALYQIYTDMIVPY